MDTEALKSYSKNLHMTNDDFINYLSKRVKACITKLIPIKNDIKEQMHKIDKKNTNSLKVGLLSNKYLIKITNIIKHYNFSIIILSLTNWQIYLGDAYYFTRSNGTLMPISMSLDYSPAPKACKKLNTMVKQGFKFDVELHGKDDTIFDVQYPTLVSALDVVNYFISNYRDFVKDINK